MSRRSRRHKYAVAIPGMYEPKEQLQQVKDELFGALHEVPTDHQTSEINEFEAESSRPWHYALTDAMYNAAKARQQFLVEHEGQPNIEYQRIGVFRPADLYYKALKYKEKAHIVAADDGFLNPFELQPPWYMNRDLEGRIYYFNAHTKEAKWERPAEVWELTMNKLGDLTPRGHGWVWRESEEQRELREQTTQWQAEQAVLERHRRRIAPNPREQIEDTLFAIVEQVEWAVLADIQQKEEEKRAQESKHFHPSFHHQSLRPLLRLPNRPRLITDLEYRRVNIIRKGEVTALNGSDPSVSVHTAVASWSRVFLRLFLAKPPPPYTAKSKRIKEQQHDSSAGERFELDHSARSEWERSLLSDLAFALAVDISSLSVEEVISKPSHFQLHKLRSDDLDAKERKKQQPAHVPLYRDPATPNTPWAFNQVRPISQREKQRIKVSIYEEQRQAIANPAHAQKNASKQPQEGDDSQLEVETAKERKPVAIAVVSLAIDECDERFQTPGYGNITAFDLAELIKAQCGTADSPLSIGPVTRHVVHVSYQSRSLVQHQPWPQYWLHFLHPAWFGYHTGKVGADASLLEDAEVASEDEIESPEAKRAHELKLWSDYEAEQSKFSILCPQMPKNGILTTAQHEAKLLADKALQRYKTFVKKQYRLVEKMTAEVEPSRSATMIDKTQSEQWIKEMKEERLAKLDERRALKEVQRNTRRYQMELRNKSSKLKSWAYQRMLKLHPLMEEFEEELPQYLSIINDGEPTTNEPEPDPELMDDVLQSKRTRELFSLLLRPDNREAQAFNADAMHLSKAAIVDFLATKPNDEDIEPKSRPRDSPVWELANSLLWVQCCIKHEVFQDLLHEMETEQPGFISKEELESFGRVCLLLYPSYQQVSSALQLAYDTKYELQLASMARSLRIAEARRRRKSSQLLSDKPEEEEVIQAITSRPIHVNAHCEQYITQEDLEHEKQNRRLGYRSRSARPKGKKYLNDHHHIYVQLGEQPEYCCLCRQRTHKATVSALRELEKRWDAYYPSFVDEAVSATESKTAFVAEWRELKRWEGLPSVSARQGHILLNLVVENMLTAVVTADAQQRPLMECYRIACEAPTDLKPRLAGDKHLHRYQPKRRGNRRRSTAADTPLTAFDFFSTQEMETINADVAEALTEFERTLQAQEAARKSMFAEEISLREEENRAAARREMAPKAQQMEFKKIFGDIQAAFPSFARLQFVKCMSHSRHNFTLQVQDPSISVAFDIVANECHRVEDEQYFIDETTRYMTTRNPHLVSIVHAGVCGVKRFTATGLCLTARYAVARVARTSGVTLLEMCQEDEITAPRLRQFSGHVLTLLNDLHAKGVLHRNLSTDVVFVREDEVEVSGHGILCGKGRPEDDWHKRHWHTTRNIPPEILEGRAATAASDVYAFGTCLFAWITKQDFHTLAKGCKPRDIIRYIPLEFHPWAPQVLHKCLEDNPDKRSPVFELLAIINTP